MTFSSLIGNDFARTFLIAAASQEKGAQAFLFTGLEGVGKRSFAKAFAKSLLGEKHASKIQSETHPDVLFFQPEGKSHMHPITSIRKIIEKAALPPFEASLKVFIIEDVERMLPSSSNALLKTLEEPYPHCRFILLTAHRDELLPTIASRCSFVPFYPIEEEVLSLHLIDMRGLTPEKAGQIALASQGVYQRAIQLIDEVEDPVYCAFTALLEKHFLYAPSFSLMDQLNDLEKLLEKKAKLESGKDLLDAMDSLLESTFFWLRDLHLLQSNTSSSLLFHAGSLEALQKQLTLGNLPSLEKGLKSMDKARLALQRSVKPRVVLENLLLACAAK